MDSHNGVEHLAPAVVAKRREGTHRRRCLHAPLGEARQPKAISGAKRLYTNGYVSRELVSDELKLASQSAEIVLPNNK